MTRELSSGLPEIAKGALAGMAGTLAMMAMRSFDHSYAPETVAKTRQDPGAFLVKHAERTAGIANHVPKPVEKAAAMSVHLAYGTLAGVAYSLIRGHRKKSSPLIEGAATGAMVYSFGYLGWLPLTGLSRPVWKQRFPEIAGGLLRHVAFGVVVSSVYGAIDDRL
jgi:uncharacterized membrane protein YagU involved in acid resistance